MSLGVMGVFSPRACGRDHRPMTITADTQPLTPDTQPLIRTELWRELAQQLRVPVRERLTTIPAALLG
jgi:hypothetical protein